MIGDKLTSDVRVGIGTDLHRLVPDRRLMLGGLYIPFDYGLAGHSDGDVVIHAVIDALLGAAALGDIGTFFPDTDASYKDIDSKELLLVTRDMLKEKGWLVANIDLTIHAQQPRLEPYKAQIKRCLASCLAIDFNSVNVKAKTAEGLGDIGEGQAISVTAIALINKLKLKQI